LASITRLRRLGAIGIVLHDRGDWAKQTVCPDSLIVSIVAGSGSIAAGTTTLSR